jgi:hypothetical protein
MGFLLMVYVPTWSCAGEFLPTNGTVSFRSPGRGLLLRALSGGLFDFEDRAAPAEADATAHQSDPVPGTE